MTIVLLSFVASFGLISSVGMLLFYRDVVFERLAELVEGRVREEHWLMRLLRAKQASVGEMVRPFQAYLPRGASETNFIKRKLIRAGYREPSAVEIFFGSKVLLPLACALLVTISGVYKLEPFLVYVVAAAAGFTLPDLWLALEVRKRQDKIRLALPEALDLMVVCTEAGLGMGQTFHRVVTELRTSQPEMSEEFHLLLLEEKAGLPREEAFKNLAERTDLDCMRTLITTLIQADVFGTSVCKTLRVYSDTMRTKRRQQAEEQAAKTTIKLIFPLVFFIFPSLFVVVLGPAGIQMYEGFIKYLLSEGSMP